MKIKNKTKKTRISYFIPNDLLIDIRWKMIKQGYDLNEKSKWISEAISKLLSTPNFSELVFISEQMDECKKLDSVTIEDNLKLKIDNAIVEIRKLFPSIEGVQSKILRTAIIQRLLRYSSVTEL